MRSSSSRLSFRSATNWANIRSAEPWKIASDAGERAAAGAFGADGREVAIRPPLGFVADVPLLLQRLERGEDGRIGERLLERVAYVGDRRRAEAPEDAHDFELARREIDVVHVGSLLVLP